MARVEHAGGILHSRALAVYYIRLRRGRRTGTAGS